jgi:uncharacterized lipoprotein YajG
MKKQLLYLSAIFLLTSCAVSRNVSYDNVNADLPKSTATISIATWDQREQVKNGSRNPDFVGYTRSAVGIAYPMGTKSGNSLAQDMTASIASSLRESGSKIAMVQTSMKDSRTMILNKLTKSKSATNILLKCNEFHTDGYGAQSLMFNIDVIVLDDKGNVIQEKQFAGKRKLGGSAFWGPGKFKTYMPAAFKTLVEEIFSDKEILNSYIAKS